MNYICKNPVLIIAFNRPDFLNKLLLTLKKVKPKKIYISIDGPRLDNFYEDNVNISKIISLIHKIKWCKFIIFKNNNNLGVGRAPYEAISKCFLKEKQLIILEDDIIPNISFFKFIDELLLLYKKDKKISHICGTNILQNNKIFNYSYDFSQVCQTYGWATWLDRWSEYKFNINDPSLFHKKPSFIYSKFIKLKHSRYWHFLFNNIINENNYDFWDYQLAYLMFKKDLFCIIPNVNLINNIGNDQRSSNTKEKFSPISHLDNSKELKFPLSHPNKVTINYLLDMRIMEKEYTLSITSRVFYKIRNLLNDFIKKIY